jgi:serine/threonine protein kinase
MSIAGDAGGPGAYSLSHLLGKNSLAETYVGEERTSGRPVVFKLFPTVRLEKERQHVVETLRAYAQVLHPGLVRVLEVGLRENSPFVVTEYAQSGSPRQRYLQGTRLRPEIVLPAVLQIGTALQHLHRQGLFHLDLKPENILLKDDGSLMLSDAGLLSLPALWQDRLAAERDNAAYLAPEQIMGLPVAASDQYALACLIYEWLSGHPPFIGSFREICAQHLHAPPPPLMGPASEELKAVLRRALEKDPGKRFPTLQAFIEACALAMRGTASQPVTASASSGSSSPVPKSLVLPPASSEQVLHQQEGKMAAEEQISQRRLCRLCRQPLPSTRLALACPSCGYPSDLQEEQRFLEQLLAELSRLAQAGAASMHLGTLASLSVPSLLALKRQVRYGAASVPLGLAIDRYWRRLLEVRQLMAREQLHGTSLAPSKAQAPQRMAAPPAVSGAAAAAPGQPAPQYGTEPAQLDDTLVRKALQAQQLQEPQHAAAQAPAASQQPALPPVLHSAHPVGEHAPASASQSSRQASEPGFQAPVASVGRPQIAMLQPSAAAISRAVSEPASLGRPPLPPRPPRPPLPSPITTLRPLIESPAALMVALGTFLLLAALLVFHIAAPEYALPVTICAQGFFALMVVITGRSRHFREFRGIYALFFALTVPLLFPDLRSIVPNGTPWLLALTALYGAVTYGVLAVSQRFSPFAILCAVALAVTDVSLVWAISPSSWGWWTASGLLVLALIETEALGDPQLAPGESPLARLLQTSWDVLRAPLAFSAQFLAYVLSCLAGLLSLLLLLLLLISQRTIDYSSTIPLSAFPITLLLALAWFMRADARLRRSSQYPLLALITLIVPLTCSLIVPQHARLMSSLDLLLLSAAFEGYARLAPPSLWPYLRPERWLTALRFLLLLLVPFLAVLPSQVTGQAGNLLLGSSLVFASAALLLLMSLWPAPEAAAEGNQRLALHVSPWLLLLPGSLLVWGYAALGQALNWASAGPLWWFGLFCGALLALSSVIHRLAGRQWAAPWEIVALAVALLILVLLPLQQDLLAMTLVPLLIGMVSYGLLIMQRRSLWLFLPGLFLGVGLLLLGLWIAESRGEMDAWAIVLLASSVLLPPLAATLRRFLPAGPAALPRGTPQDWQAERLFTFWEWDWPLTAVALGTSLWLAVLLLVDWTHSFDHSLPQWYWSSMALASLSPGSEWLAVGEALVMALTSYLAGLWARTRLWLVPAALLALVALWLAQNEFVALTAVAVGTAVVGMLVSHLRGQRWALPWYVAGLFSLLLVMGHALPPRENTPQAYSAFVLLGLAGVVTAVGLAGKQPEPLWLAPLLLLEGSIATLLSPQSLSNALLLLGQVPLSALAGLGLRAWQRRRPQVAGGRWRWTLPWYTAGLVSIGATSFALLDPQLWATSLPALAQLGPYVLLACAGLATAVALLEQTPALLWLVPLLTVLATLTAQRYQGPALLPPVLVLLCTLVALVTSQLVQGRLMHLSTLSASRLRLRLGAPWYVTAAFAACATPTFPFVTENLGATTVAILLLVYTLLAFVVAVGERWPLASLATSIFGLWGLGEITGVPALTWLLLPVGIGALAIAFLADRLLRSNTSGWSPALTRLIRPSWALAWVPFIVLTWSMLGLFHPHPWPVTRLPAADSWGPALAALLVYGSGLLLRQVAVCWLGVLLALFSIVQLSAGSGQGRPDMAGLALFCLLCTIGLACGALLERHWPLRAYVFPLLAANCSGVLAVGITGTLATEQSSVLGASALLLGYGLLIWLLALGLRLPVLTLLTGLWTAWGLVLLVGFQQLSLPFPLPQVFLTRDQILTIIGTIATLLGLLGLRRRPDQSVSWRRGAPSTSAPSHEEKAR